jgi:predicted PurR-regulated permease PerM
MITDAEKIARQKRAKIVYTGAFLLVAGLGLFIFVSLRALILPTIIGALSAYLCRPLLMFMKRRRIPRGASILILFGLFFLILFIIVSQIQGIIPDEKGKMVLQVRIQYKINEKYKEYMGIDTSGAEGNFIYNMVGKEVDPLINKLNDLLMFTEEDKELFDQYASGAIDGKPVEEKFMGYYRANLIAAQHKAIEQAEKAQAQAEASETAVADASEQEGEKEPSKIAIVLDVISLWIVMPFVFLFLLIDDGEIKKSLVSLIPNQYFEVALTVIDNVDEAIGNYLRGTILECSLVGLTFIICLAIIGIDFKWAIIIGVIAGTANAIPFLGPAIGLVVGASYGLIAEEAQSILPFMNANNLVIGVLVTVGIAQGLDNAVFQPIVLGGAVNLHPLIVIIGVMGGSIMFGFFGMLFAIPTIVVFKEIFTTTMRQFKAYQII